MDVFELRRKVRELEAWREEVEEYLAKVAEAIRELETKRTARIDLPDWTSTD